MCLWFIDLLFETGETWSHEAKMTSVWNQNFRHVRTPARELVWTWCHHISKLHINMRLRLPFYRLLVDTGWQKHLSVESRLLSMFFTLMWPIWQKEKENRVLWKHSAVASSGAKSNQSWAFQHIWQTFSLSIGLRPLPSQSRPCSTVGWLLLLPVFPSREHAEEGQKPVSCNQTLCSAPATQRTPLEKLKNITSEMLIYHSDEIMKLVSPASFYCFFWSTNK